MKHVSSSVLLLAIFLYTSGIHGAASSSHAPSKVASSSSSASSSSVASTGSLPCESTGLSSSPSSSLRLKPRLIKGMTEIEYLQSQGWSEDEIIDFVKRVGYGPTTYFDPNTKEGKALANMLMRFISEKEIHHMFKLMQEYLDKHEQISRKYPPTSKMSEEQMSAFTQEQMKETGPIADSLNEFSQIKEKLYNALYHQLAIELGTESVKKLFRKPNNKRLGSD